MSYFSLVFPVFDHTLHLSFLSYSYRFRLPCYSYKIYPICYSYKMYPTSQLFFYHFYFTTCSFQNVIHISLSLNFIQYFTFHKINLLCFFLPFFSYNTIFLVNFDEFSADLIFIYKYLVLRTTNNSKFRCKVLCIQIPCENW